MANRRPSIKSPCVADRHHMEGERIAEFMTPNGKGGLIRVHEYSDGPVTVEVYRCDEGIRVIAPRMDRAAAVEAIAAQFRTFGGGKGRSTGNPIAAALADGPAQFAAGVSVADVVEAVLAMAGR